MNKLTDLEIVKVFSLYPECPTLIFDSNPPVPDKVEGIIYRLPQIYCEHVSWPPITVKLVLKQLKYMPNQDILFAAKTYDNTGFVGTTGKTIQIPPKENEPIIRQIMFGPDWPFMYNVNLETGSITMFREGRAFGASDTQLLLTQFYLKNNYAIPLYFEPGHWANGKTAIDLGIAVPDRWLLFKLLHQKFASNEDIRTWIFEREKLLRKSFFDPKNLDEAINELQNE